MTAATKPIHRTAGFSYALSAIYVAFVGNRVPFNVDTIQAIESLWMDIKTDDGQGSVAPKVRDVSYSAPLTYNQEKAGDVREAVARIVVPKGYESAYFASIRKNITGFDISLLPEFRKAETQKGTPSRGRGRKIPLGLGLRSSAKDVNARIAADRLSATVKAAAREGAKLSKVWNQDQQAKAFTSFLEMKPERKSFFANLSEGPAAEVRAAFYTAFEGKEAAQPDMFPDESKLPKGKMIADDLSFQGMPSFLYKAWEPRNNRPYFLVKGFGPHTQAPLWLTEEQAKPLLAKQASSKKTAGMGKAEYLRRLRDLKAKLNHLMSDASVSGTAPKNLRRAEAALDAEIEAIRSVGKKEKDEEEQAVEASAKKGK